MQIKAPVRNASEQEFLFMELQNSLNKQEAIRRIEQVYHARYNPNMADFDAYEQLLVCESLAETVAKEQERYGGTDEDVSVKWNGNDTYKRNVNPELTESKHKAIAELRTLNFRTSPIKIAEVLEILFAEYNSKAGWWLYVAQNWNPRAINRVINYMIKAHVTGRKTIQNPAAYFTYLIKFRKKRRSL